MSIKSVSKPVVIITAAGAVALSVGNYIWQQEHRPKRLEVYVFALDKGHAIFIRTPEDKRILINGGYNSEIVNKLTGILPFYSKRIDMIFATNTADNDIAGLIEILDRYRVEKIYVPAITLKSLGLASSTGTSYEIFTEKVTSNNIGIEDLLSGRKIVLDEDVYADILFPVPEGEFKYSKASPPELIMSITYKSSRFLLLGGASVKTQKYVASSSVGLTQKRHGSFGGSDNTVLIVNGSAMPTNIASKLVEIFGPSYLVYSRMLSSIGKVANVKKKIVADPLGDITGDHKFNLKEVGDLHMITDGRELIYESD
ncbi:MAG: hypothetical protein WCP09_03680 [Candidatus Taylorbacteria bacterium]